MGFPAGSVLKNPPANAGVTDVGSIPGWGRSPGEGKSNPLQSLVAQLVKNLPAIQETPVRFLSQEDLLEKRQATHSSILGLPLVAQRVKNLPTLCET